MPIDNKNTNHHIRGMAREHDKRMQEVQLETINLEYIIKGQKFLINCLVIIILGLLVISVVALKGMTCL